MTFSLCGIEQIAQPENQLSFPVNPAFQEQLEALRGTSGCKWVLRVALRRD